MLTLPPALLRAEQAADEPDVLHALVDWELSQAGAWSRALASPFIDPQCRDELIESGIGELEAASRRPDLVRSHIEELSKALKRSQLRPATSDEADAALELLRVVEPLSYTPVAVARRLATCRVRASEVREVWVAEDPPRKDRYFAISPTGERIILVPTR